MHLYTKEPLESCVFPPSNFPSSSLNRSTPRRRPHLVCLFVLLLLALEMSTVVLPVRGSSASTSTPVDTCEDSTGSSSSCSATANGGNPNKRARTSSNSGLPNTRLTLSTISSKVLHAEYAVRGTVLLRAMEIEKEMKLNASKFPFPNVVYCNIGNPHSLGQKPLSFTRRVQSLVLNPELLSYADKGLLPDYRPDVVARAKAYIGSIHGGVGAYSESQGVSIVRDEVAKYIHERDGFWCNPADVFLSAGASQGVEYMMRSLLRTPDDAILVPVPQYPLYSALTSLLEGHFEGYTLAEEGGWDSDLAALAAATKRARDAGKIPRAIVVINPGNPTGNTLSASVIKSILLFAAKEGLVVMADEVYQANVYTAPERPFVSFRKVLLEQTITKRDKDYDPVQLVSFHSVSKGVSGECGMRGGYFELVGFDSAVKAQILKLASIQLCPNILGQLAVGLMVHTPAPGEASYEEDSAERTAIFASLERRAKKTALALNKLTGVVCNPVEGAMYAFPRLTLPPKLVAEAERLKMHPDSLYSLRMLEETGVVVVPGNGFGQRDGTFHFRTTILPPEDVFDDVLDRMSKFHEKFIQSFA